MERKAATMRFFPALSMSVAIILGSGMLVLPGQVMDRAGAGAVWTWCLGSALMGLILVSLYRLDLRTPGARGVHDLIGAHLGEPWRVGIHRLTAATFGIGIPGIALTAGTYVCELAGLAERWVTPMTWILLLLCLAAFTAGDRASTRAQTVVTGGVLVSVVPLVVAALVLGSRSGDPAVEPTGWRPLSAVSVCFFAFAGWELVTFLRPRLHGGRPVYRALLVSSWLGVCGLYILLALALRLVPPSSSANSLVPLAASVGLGELLPMVVACVIMAASLLGNLFGFRDVVSGLVGLRARGRAVENLVPVGWVAAVCGAGLFLDRPQELFFAVAGGSFLFIYVAACVAAARSEDGGVERAVSWVAALGGAVMIALNVRASLLPVAFLVSLAGTELARRARSAQRG